MINLGPETLDHQTRFLYDNIIDGVRDGTTLMWQAWDSQEGKKVWILGRKVPPDKVLPIAVLVNPPDAVKRYAPSKGSDDFDWSQVVTRIIRP